MVVFHLIFSFTVGGAETMLVDIANKQCRKANVRVIVINDHMDEALLRTLDPQIKVTLLKRQKGNKYNIGFLLKLWYLIITQRPDVLHCHNPELFPLISFWKNKTYITLHDVNEPLHHVKKFRTIFAISNAVANDIRSRGGLNSVVVYNGILVAEYERRPNYDHKTDDNFKVIQISRLMPAKKGQDVAIKAIAHIVEHYPHINIELTFAGDGDAITDLEALARQVGVKDRITFLGSVSRNWVKQYLRTYHVLIQPSLYEGFGLTVVEGLAAGLPVIATALDGPMEILHTLKIGTLCEVNSPVSLAQKIVEIYELYKLDSVAGNTSVLCDDDKLDIFDIKNTAEKYLKAYKN